MTEDSGAWQKIKGKTNEIVGDVTNDPDRKEKGILQEKAGEGKKADTQLQRRDETP